MPDPTVVPCGIVQIEKQSPYLAGLVACSYVQLPIGTGRLSVEGLLPYFLEGSEMTGVDPDSLQSC